MSKSKQIIELEEEHTAHNYHPLPVVLAKGSGVHVWDVEGIRYIDCLAAYSAVNQGKLFCFSLLLTNHIP